MKRRRILLLLGVFLALAILSYAQEIALEKDHYLVGEEVLISLQGNFTSLEISGPVTSYFFNPQPKTRYFSRVPGMYDLLLYDQDQLVGRDSFVVEGAEQELIFTTAKNSYVMGETVEFVLDKAKTNFFIRIINNDKAYLVYDLDGQIKFKPKNSGLHKAVLHEGNIEIAQIDFFVESKTLTLVSKSKSGQVNLTDIRGKQVLRLKNSSIKHLEFNNMDLNSDPVLRIDDDIAKDYNFEQRNSVKTYAIDPTGVEFEDAIVTVEAKGTELWKCKDWDYAQQACYGSWVKLKDITPGQNYSFLLTALDPGFAETNWWNSSWEKRLEINITENSGQTLSEYQIRFNLDTKTLISQGLMNTDCSDIRFVDEDNELLSHFVDETPRYKCNASETLLWVKTSEIPASETTSVYMYYNKSDASSVSNKSEVFTYSSSKKIYYVVGENVDSNDLAIVSYVDDNTVSIGQTKIRSIDRGQVNTDFLSSDISPGTGFNVTGPIVGGANMESGDGDALIPISWAGKEFVLRTTRDNVLAFYVFAPFCNTDVDIYLAASGDSSWGSVDETMSLSQGTVQVTTTANFPQTQSLYFNATCPVLVYMQDEASGDEYNTPIYPMADDLWGISTFEVANYVAGNRVAMMGSDDTISNTTRGATDNWQGNGGSADGQGTAYHLISDEASIGGMQSADSDGNEESYGLPEFELDTEYFIYDDGQYVTGAVTRPNINCYRIDNSGVEQESTTSSISGGRDYPYPAKLWFGEADANPVDDWVLEGDRITCDDPFYMYFEDSDGAGGNGGDEQVVYGWKSARQYVYPEPSLSISFTGQGKPELGISAEFNESPAIVVQNQEILFYANCSNLVHDAISINDVYLILQDNFTGVFTETNISGGLYSNVSNYFIGNLSGGENSSTYSFKIKGTYPGEYAFRAVCDASNLEAVNSTQYSLSLLDVVGPAISNVRNESITDVAAVILWDTNEAANSTVLYGETASFGYNKTSSAYLAGHSVPLTGLSSDTTYFYNVSSCDPSGNCNSSGTFNFTTSSTPDIIPPAIYDVNVSELTEGTARINWTTDEAANSTVFYGETQALGSNKTRLFYVTQRSIVLSGLDPNTLYYFNLTSCDLAGNCNTSGYFNFTTIDVTSPVVSLEYPLDASFVNLDPVEIRFNVSDNDRIHNCTVYSDFNGSWSSNETVYSPDMYTTITIPVYLSTGSYKWNIICYDQVGNFDWNDFNYTFSQEDRIMSIAENVLPNGTYPGDTVVVYGKINLSDGTDVVNNTLYIYLNDTLLNDEAGDGSDGTISISYPEHVVNKYTYITQNVSSGQLEIEVDDVADFNIGDEVLIHQTQNGTTECTAGIYEFRRIVDITGSNLTFDTGLSNDYCYNNPNTVSTDCTDTLSGFDSAVAQIVSVPQYRYLTIEPGAYLTAPAWNGYYGGIVVLKSQEGVEIEGSIDVTGKGFRGGQDGFNDDSEGGTGEGINGWGYNPEAGDYSSGDWEVAGNCMQDPNGIGGAGSWCSDDNGGDPGAGGGHGTAGESMQQDQGQATSEGGSTIGNVQLSLMYFGGGGGAGSDNDNEDPEGDGGEGGGIVYIVSKSIEGSIIADGHEGYGDSGVTTSATGGGGAGGSIWLRANYINLTAASAVGGLGGDDGSEPGGLGGDGRIRLDYISADGIPSPAAGYTETFSTLTTNSTGHYTYNITTPLLSGIYRVIINSTYNIIISKEVEELLVLDADNPNATFDIVSPDPAERIYEDVEVNFTVEDIHLDYYFVNVTYPNKTLMGIFYDDFVLTKENLSAGGIYNMTIYSVDLAYNENITYYELTVEDTIMPNASDLRNESITNETALIKWDTNEPANSTVYYSETGFFIDYFFVGGYTYTHSVPLSGLDPNTFYYYYIRSCDPYGNCLDNATFNFTTESTGDTDPPDIFNVNVSNIGETTAIINWTTSENSNSTVNYNETAILENSVFSPVYELDHSIALTDLAPNTLYYFNVSSCDLSGNCNSSKTYNFTTIDITGPNITSLLNPNQNSKHRYNIIDFNFTANDNDEIDNCSLWADFFGSFSINETIYNVQEDQETNITLVVPDGSFNWNIICYDISGNPGQYEVNYSFSVDTQPPSAFSLVSPLNQSSLSDYTPYLSWTASNDNNFKNYTILVDQSNDFSSIDYTYSTSGINFFQIEDSWTINKTFYWKVIAFDSFNNSFSTGTFNYFTLPVNVTITLQVDPKYIRQQTEINLSGKINLTSGQNLSYNPIYIYVNDSLVVKPGDGSEGSYTATSVDEVINEYDYIVSNVSSGQVEITLNDTTGFFIGDEVMIHQTQNGTSNCRAGTYEFIRIENITGNNVSFKAPLKNKYCFNNPNTVSTDCTDTLSGFDSAIAQIVRVPQYENLTVQSGASITALPWNGYYGGIVTFKVQYKTIIDGSINVTGKGFRGGQSGIDDDSEGGTGESVSGWGYNPEAGDYPTGDWEVAGTCMQDPNGIGGAGSWCSDDNGGDPGAGGGHGTAGQDAAQDEGDGDLNSEGGSAIGGANLTELYFGGGGGGGSDNDNGNPESDGGAGGGIIFIASQEINGSLYSKGEDGKTDSSSSFTGAGGGGAGGTIWLSAYALNLAAADAQGGVGGDDADEPGGNGGDGRIRIDYLTLSASPDPAVGYSESPYTLISDDNGLFSLLIESFDTEGAYEIRVNSSYETINGYLTDYYFFDLSKPFLILNYPYIDANYSDYADINYNWTVVDNFASELLCNLTVNNSIVNPEPIVSLNSTAQNYSTGLGAGYYEWNVTCWDNVANTNTSNSRNVTVLTYPVEFLTNITQAAGFEIDWSPSLYTDSYSIFISKNYSQGFSQTPNYTGLTDTNWTDPDAFNDTKRFYKVAAVKGDAVSLSNKTTGIHTRNINSTWSLISLPFNISEWVLYDGSSGKDIYTNPEDCIVSLWYYNETNQSYLRTDYLGGIWTPAIGSEFFTSLESNRGYWAELSEPCNISFYGIVPLRNSTIGLEQYWNIVGQYSVKDQVLGDESVSKVIDVDPENSTSAILRYNTAEDEFEVTVHWPGYGWFPSFNNQDFLYLEPFQGYYFDQLERANWTHDPDKN